MKVFVRLYNSHDDDLLLLAEHYNLSKLFKLTVESFAQGKNLKLNVKDIAFIPRNDTSDERISFTTSDIMATKMLNAIKYGQRSSFCKAVLRQSLGEITLCRFFEDNCDTYVKDKDDAVVDLDIQFESIFRKTRKPRTVKNHDNDVFLSAFMSIK